MITTDSPICLGTSNKLIRSKRNFFYHPFNRYIFKAMKSYPLQLFNSVLVMHKISFAQVNVNLKRETTHQRNNFTFE